MIGATDKRYRGLPEPIIQQIKRLKLAAGADTAGAVIAQGIARLLGGYGCMSCGVYYGEDPIQRAPGVDSTRWPELREKHVQGCKWIRTKGFRIRGPW